MSIRQTLNEVLAGTKPPAAFLAAVDEYLAAPNANTAALRSLIDAAEQLGLPADIAAEARARLPGDDGVMGIGEPTKVAGSDDTTEIISPDATKADIGEPTKLVDEGDTDKTVITTGSEATHLRADPADVDLDRTMLTGDADRTVITDTDTTQINPDTDATVQVGGEDPFAMATAPAKADDELGPGSVLKGRFRLEEVIGQGGMGAVYKAVDLLKVEARDRNPYMAVKLLVGDFKEHPEAFIALQRESAKAQRLAHPNIATVYDFDRDGETVYMTMELMVGAELAKYIKKLPAGGLPVPEAMKIVEQLCSGLQYAHARGLVHSDFKPGNAFLLEDGTVKLLDFGIARASKTKADAEGESTVFDPGQLGALTPAYATIEMFEGQDPDPRDDIYALACVTYELFTGKHPFNKMSAVKAKEKGLKPAPVDKLTKRQNKVLLKALALHRDDRTPSVEEFWENIKPRKDYTLHIAAGATAGILILGALLYNPVLDLIHQREHDALVTEIASGDEARLMAALEKVDQLPAERQRIVTESAQERLFSFYMGRAEEAAADLEFSDALAEIAVLDRYFPNHSDVFRKNEELIAAQNTVRSELVTEFENLLANGPLLPDPDARDLTDVVAELRLVDAESGLLSDSRVTDAYIPLAERAIAAGQWQQASDVVKAGLAYRTDPELLDLRDRVDSELRRQEEAALVAELQGRLRQAQPRTLDDFRAINADLQRLGTLRPSDSVVRGYDDELEAVLGGAIAAATGAADWNAAEALLAEFAQVMPLDFLVAQRLALSSAESDAGFTLIAAQSAERQQSLQAVRGLLASPTFEDRFDAELLGAFKAATARLGPDVSAWEALRSDVAQAHIAAADDLIAANRYDKATEVLERGATYAPDFAEFTDARQRLVDARAAYDAEQQRLAAIEAITRGKERVRVFARSNDSNAAIEAFNALRRQLPADDPFITTEGPEILATMYENLAGQTDNPARALDLARAGLRVLPNSETLRNLVTTLEGEVERAGIVARVATLTDERAAEFGRDYQAARQGIPEADAQAFERSVVDALVLRLNTLERTREGAVLRRSVVDLFSQAQRTQLNRLNLREPEAPSRFAGRIQEAIDARNLTAAENLLNEANRAEPGHTQLAAIATTLERLQGEAEALYSQAMEQQSNRANAVRLITQALALWQDNPDFIAFQRRFQGNRGGTVQNDGSQACTAGLSTYGDVVGRGQCWDVVDGNRTKGPVLAVVPGVNGGPLFAISVAEITIEDFNRFCATGACQPLSGDEGLPASGIGIATIDAYIAWLGEVTGVTYRLPTDAEWVHAAKAAGEAGDDSLFWCKATDPRGNVIKGGNPHRVTAGVKNGWGLIDAVGNVQELVRDGTTLRARGGNYSDSFSNCSADLVRPHDGSADAVTGFRVVRGL